MRILLLFLLTVGIGLVSCKPKTALEYNQRVIDIENSLRGEIQVTQDKLISFMEKQQYDSVAAVSLRMENVVGAKIDELERIPAPDVKEGDNLKKASLRYFRYFKSVYAAYREFAQDPSDSKRLALQLIPTRASAALLDIQQAQRKYAEANGFRLDKK